MKEHQSLSAGIILLRMVCKQATLQRKAEARRLRFPAEGRFWTLSYCERRAEVTQGW